MKKSVMKIAAPCLCVSLALGGAGGAYRALASGSEAAPAALRTEAAAPVKAEAPAMDETVYVLAGADGSVEKVIVSDWLKNTGGSAALAGSSGLTEVENVKGAESFTLQDGTPVWDAQGNDIYCQGTTDRELPVEIKVSYTLDGKAVTARELAGKSGHVAIRFDYTNRQYRQVEIDGRMEQVCVPFAMLTGMVLDNDVFTNVEISNGRVYSDGARTVAAGIAFPGLQESLDLDREKLELPSYMEVTADVENFELATTFTLADGSFFADAETGDLDLDGDLSGSLRELTDAMEQLKDGSNRLYDGLETLLASSGELAEGVSQLSGGAAQVKDGAAGLKDGAAALRDGVGNLSAGAGSLQEGAGALDQGASQLSEGAEALSGGLETLTARNDTLNGGAQQVFASLLASASSQLKAAGAQVPDLTAENYAKVLDGAASSLKGSPAAEQIAALKASLDSYSAFCQGLAQYTAGVAQAAEGAKGLTSGASQLSDGAKELQSGIQQLSQGADALQGGAAQLSDGAQQLSDGAGQLHGGILQLQGKLPSLTEGVTQLRDGAKELSDGLVEFDEQGIQKLVDAVDGDLAGLTARLRATVDAAKDYTSFSDAPDGAESQVKFIYRTAAIETEE